MADMVPEDDLSFIASHSKQKQYLYVRVVKARDLIGKDVTGSFDHYVEVRLGNYKETTRRLTSSEKNSNPEWNQVFAFPRDKIGEYDATILEVSLENKGVTKDDFLGWVLYDLCVVPNIRPTDSPLDPKWYKLVDRKGEKAKGELMLAVWWGIQADEAYLKANDASTDLINNQSNVYQLPRLWYVRLHVIAGKGLTPSDGAPDFEPKICVKATIGNQSLRTRQVNGSKDPMWNEDLMLVAAEPFEEHLILSVEDMSCTYNTSEVLGSCIIPLKYVDRRCDGTPIKLKCFKLHRDVFAKGRKVKRVMFGGMIHMRICLEGGYHVLLEPSRLISDLRPTDKQLWKKSIGILELGILSAHGLLPMKIDDDKLTTDAYCVAKYGTKWVRTRTIINSFTPKWNEQYTWDVFDPCTVITIGVFDNGNGARDSRIGKVRIRLSTLETNRVYTHSYPLLVLHPSGVKKMGEIHLVVRLTCSSLLNMLHMYSQPLWPKMHYIHPLTAAQLDSLRHQATQIVSMRLSRAEPPLRKEIVEYMLDVGSHMWSMRRSKGNFFRIMSLLSGLISFRRWSSGMYNWQNPITVVVFHIIFFLLLAYTELMPLIFVYLSFCGVLNYRWRPRHPPHMDTRVSFADGAHPDELDEEFDTFPTSREGDMVLRMRYDRLRSIFGRIQIVVGDLATLGERLQSLLSWRDPRATALFVIFCLIAAVLLYVIPFYAVAIQTILYVSKPSRPKNNIPSLLFNFFLRLPDRNDQML